MTEEIKIRALIYNTHSEEITVLFFDDEKGKFCSESYELSDVKISDDKKTHLYVIEEEKRKFFGGKKVVRNYELHLSKEPLISLDAGWEESHYNSATKTSTTKHYSQGGNISF